MVATGATIPGNLLKCANILDTTSFAINICAFIRWPYWPTFGLQFS